MYGHPIHHFSIYYSLCMDTRSIILLYIILYVWTPDPSYYSLCMDTRSIIFLYIIDVWTPDPSSFDIWLMYGHPIHHLFYVLLMYGHPIHHLLIYYWCMDTRSIIFLCIIDVWTPDPSSFELHTVTIVCLYTVLSLRVKGARLYVWYNLTWWIH